ncbi:hypothetical protein NOVOSPHI9U_210041 [Novosphingobium sp. 9U]|nr:hypothetical protein NOVOSPHI9U_210041 [Novosphingobium sp. 9U]
MPDCIGNFQNSDFSKRSCHYALAFVERIPWIQLYTLSSTCTSARADYFTVNTMRPAHRAIDSYTVVCLS